MNPRPPDFICIGAQKAGTFWLRENLRKHPAIWMPILPEIHYFDEPLGGAPFPARIAQHRAADGLWRNANLTRIQQLAQSGDVRNAAWWATHAFLDRDDLWYRTLFAFAPPGSTTGDITPRYMLCGAREIAHMHRVAPQARLLFLLRHPVDRFWSQCRMKHRENTLAPGEAAALHLLDSPLGKPRGIYSEAILRFCQSFRPEQMLLVFHDAIARQPLSVMQAVFEFLRLPPAPLHLAELREPVNQAPTRDPMPPGLKARVTAAYRSEMERLAAVFGGYATGWLEDRLPDGNPPSTLAVTRDHLVHLEQHARAIRHRNTACGKIFVLSMQRSGTTSVGDWLESHSLVRAGAPTSMRMGWTRLWMQGAYEQIFNSHDFERAQVFEDDPWWCPGFFRILAERFPQARFVLLERDADDWFDSLCHHSGGRNPGWTDVHARIYQREADLQELLDHHPGLSPDAWNLLSLVDHREHYQAIYRRHYQEVRDHFAHQPHRLFHGRLEDPEVFHQLAAFVGFQPNPAIPVPRSNARTEAMRTNLAKHLQERTDLPDGPPQATPIHSGKDLPLTVFIISWGRPIYLWSCLDALFRLTRSPARFILLDNAHPDPLVGQVIAGFERRGMFAEVVRFPTNSWSNICQAYHERLTGLGPLHGYIESDCVVEPGPACWLAEMRRIMEQHPRIGVLGSLINPGDFVSREKALEITGGDAVAADLMAKLSSRERAFLQEPCWADTSSDYVFTAPPFPLTNPPGRLMLLRTPLMTQVGLQLDGPLATAVRQMGFEPAITPRVRHRHLSLLNIFDYAQEDYRARTSFFPSNTSPLP